MQQWQASRPGERIIEVDLPLSYGLCHVSQPLNPNFLNTVELLWDPMKEVGVYIKVNCISTEFTPKKHGGEKGVPFRLQIETYIESSNNTNINTNNPATSGAKSPSGLQSGASPTQGCNVTPNSSMVGLAVVKQPIHAAACQVKVNLITLKINQLIISIIRFSNNISIFLIRSLISRLTNPNKNKIFC